MVVVGKPDFGCFGVGLDGVSAVATNDEAVYGYRSGIARDAQTRIAVDKQSPTPAMGRTSLCIAILENLRGLRKISQNRGN